MIQSSIWPTPEIATKINSQKAFWLKHVNEDTSIAQIKLMANCEKVNPDEGDPYYEYNSLEIQVQTRSKLKKYIRDNFDMLWTGAVIEGTKERINPLPKPVRKMTEDEEAE